MILCHACFDHDHDNCLGECDCTCASDRALKKLFMPPADEPRYLKCSDGDMMIESYPNETEMVVAMQMHQALTGHEAFEILPHSDINLTMPEEGFRL